MPAGTSFCNELLNDFSSGTADETLGNNGYVMKHRLSAYLLHENQVRTNYQ